MFSSAWFYFVLGVISGVILTFAIIASRIGTLMENLEG